MTCIKHMDQREDGGFNYFVIFGDKCAPWEAGDDDAIQCASENDADKLLKIASALDIREGLRAQAARDVTESRWCVTQQIAEYLEQNGHAEAAVEVRGRAWA